MIDVKSGEEGLASVNAVETVNTENYSEDSGPDKKGVFMDPASQEGTTNTSNEAHTQSVMGELDTTQPEGVTNTEMVASWIARYFSECTGKEAGSLMGALDAGGKRIVYLDLGMIIAPLVCFPIGVLVAYALKKYFSGGMA